MRNSFTIFTIGMMLAAFGAAGMQSCGKEDAPASPKQEKPTTPDDPDTPDPPREPFDPTKPYKPKNKLLQVFKHGYPKYRSASRGIAPQNTGGVEYVVDDNNNLVAIRTKSGVIAEFEYGYFPDSIGNVYQVKFTVHNGSSEYGDYDDVWLCMLNENEMIVDQYDQQSNTGYYYEYKNNHIAKISFYRVIAGQKILDCVTGAYEWNSNILIAYKWWNIEGTEYVDNFEYGSPDFLLPNRGAIFSIYGYSGIDNNLYMAALMGEPSEYIPTSFFDYNVNEVQLNSNGLPEKIVLSKIYNNRVDYYTVKYIWRDLTKNE